MRFTLVLLLSLLWTRAVCGITIETAPVGNAGNSNNPATGYGAVNYGYDIGKYEVTVGQYTAFLNSVAGSDPYSLFNTSMGTDLSVAGIMRTGVSGTATA